MHVKKGQKYIKVMKDMSNVNVQFGGFIVASENDKKFQVKVTYFHGKRKLRSPARNKAR